MTNATLQNRTMAFHSWLKSRQKVQFREAALFAINGLFAVNVLFAINPLFAINVRCQSSKYENGF